MKREEVERLVDETAQRLAALLGESLAEVEAINTHRQRQELSGQVAVALEQELPDVLAEYLDLEILSGHLALKYLCQEEWGSLFVLEQAPCQKTIRVDPALQQKYNLRRGHCTLALPYVVFVAALNHGGCDVLRCYFRKAPWGSLSDALFVAPLPNIYSESHTVCLGTFDDYSGSDAEVALRMVNFFWQAVFNTDLPQNQDIGQRYCENVRLDRWAAATAADPHRFRRRLKLAPADQTVATVLHQMRQGAVRNSEKWISDLAIRSAQQGLKRLGAVKGTDWTRVVAAILQDPAGREILTDAVHQAIETLRETDDDHAEDPESRRPGWGWRPHRR